MGTSFLGMVEIQRHVHGVHADLRHMDHVILVIAKDVQQLFHRARQLLELLARELHFLVANAAVEGIDALGYASDGEYTDTMHGGGAQAAIDFIVQVLQQLLLELTHQDYPGDCSSA